MKIEDLKNEENNEYVGKYIETSKKVDETSIKHDASEGKKYDKGLQKKLPTKFGMWSKVKSFLFNEIGFSKKVVLEVSPKEEKVLTEVHDFLFQEISFSGLFSLGKGKKNDKHQQEKL